MESNAKNVVTRESVLAAATMVEGAHMNGRDNIHPCPRGGNSAKGATYNEKQIAWELERTALGDGFYGNALRVAKDMPGVTADDRALLDRFATGMSRATDHVDLQDLAMRIYAAPQAPPAAVPAGYALVPVEPTEAMLNAARDWSLKKYGQAVGNDGARGCYAAMLAAANKE